MDPDSVMISTPLDKYEQDVYELAEHLANETGLECSKKKNRVMFPKDEKLLKVLGVEEQKGKSDIVGTQRVSGWL